MGFGGKECSLKLNNHVVPFLLGAALPTILLFLLASDRLGDQLSIIASLGGGAQLSSHARGVNLSRDASADTAEKEKFPGLAELLPKVATDDRTVIITSVNEAFARPDSLLGLFRESFRNGENIEHLLDHLLVVAVDGKAFKHCQSMHPFCYLLEVTTMDLSSANSFMSEAYLELVWTKLKLQQRVLELGYNYLFTDVDIVWLRDPFRHISLYADMTVSTDRFKGEPDALTNAANTGFYYVKSTNRTVEMLRYWQAARSRFPPNHDQAIFDGIKHELADNLGVKFVFLETALFGGFCQYHDEMDRVCTMHANCCIGLDNKMHDMRNVMADWKNYTSLPPPEKRSGKFRWTVPARCQASMGH